MPKFPTKKLSPLARKNALEAALRRLFSAASLMQNANGAPDLNTLELAMEDADAAARLLERVHATDIECPTCLGYGHLGEDGPSIDRRKCGDCGGTGQM